MSDCNRYIIHNPGIQHSHTLRYFSQAHDQGSKNREQISTVSIIYFFSEGLLLLFTLLDYSHNITVCVGEAVSTSCGWLHIFISLFATSSGSVRTPARYNGDCVWHNVAWCTADWGYLHKHTHHYINNSAPAPSHYFTNSLLQTRILWN